MHQRGSGTGESPSTPTSSTRSRQQLPSRGSSTISDTAGRTSKTMRSVASMRGPARATMHSSSKHGGDRPEHPLSSVSRAAAMEEGSAAEDAPAVLGVTVSSRGVAGYRRATSEMASSHGYVW